MVAASRPPVGTVPRGSMPVATRPAGSQPARRAPQSLAPQDEDSQPESSRAPRSSGPAPKEAQQGLMDHPGFPAAEVYDKPPLDVGFGILSLQNAENYANKAFGAGLDWLTEEPKDKHPAPKGHQGPHHADRGELLASPRTPTQVADGRTTPTGRGSGGRT